MKKILFLLSLAVSFLILSCQHQPIIHTPPSVEVLEPNDTGMLGNLYHNNDTIHIEVSFSDEDALHEAAIYVNSDVDTFFVYEPYVHELESLYVDTFWVVTGMTTGVSGFVTAVASNQHELTTIFNEPITLVP